MIEVGRGGESIGQVGPDFRPEDQQLPERLAAAPALVAGRPSGVTGIFYHPSFSRRSYLTTGRRLANFPAALDPLLRYPHVKLFECAPAADAPILLAHDPRLIPEVEADPL